MIIPNIWENKIDVSNHQPGNISAETSLVTTELQSFSRFRWISSADHAVMGSTGGVPVSY